MRSNEPIGLSCEIKNLSQKEVTVLAGLPMKYMKIVFTERKKERTKLF